MIKLPLISVCALPLLGCFIFDLLFLTSLRFRRLLGSYFCVSRGWRVPGLEIEFGIAVGFAFQVLQDSELEIFRCFIYNGFVSAATFGFPSSLFVNIYAMCVWLVLLWTLPRDSFFDLLWTRFSPPPS